MRLWVEIMSISWDPEPKNVSLLVRLWVEMFSMGIVLLLRLLSASLWGCELKWQSHCLRLFQHAVSLLVRLWVEISRLMKFSRMLVVSLLVRLWVEILIFLQFAWLPGQPPCEAVSWNFYVDWPFLHRYRSAFLSVEMPFWLCHNRHDIGQSLWETVNWKEEYGVIVVAARKLTSILLEEDCEMNHSHI